MDFVVRTKKCCAHKRYFSENKVNFNTKIGHQTLENVYVEKLQPK